MHLIPLFSGTGVCEKKRHRSWISQKQVCGEPSPPPSVKVDVCFLGLEAERKKAPHLHNQVLERTASTLTNGGKGSQESYFGNMRTAPYFADTGVRKNTIFVASCLGSDRPRFSRPLKDSRNHRTHAAEAWPVQKRHEFQ